MKIFEVTEPSFEIHSVSGSELGEHFDQVANLVASGNEVDMSIAVNNLKKAPLVIYATDPNGKPIGVVVLKDPNPSYRESVFAKSGSENDGRFRYEVGYVYVVPTYRSTGASVRLIRELARRLTMPVFATTRENNTTINKILQYGGFKQTGNMYSSQRGDYNLILWTKGQ